MRTYNFNGTINVSCNAPLKVGDIVKGLDISKVGKDNKPTLCTIKVLEVKEVVANVFYQGTCEMVQVASTSNILDYNLYYVGDIQNTDLLQVSTINFMRENGFAIYCQSSGYRDSTTGESLPLASQLKLLEHRVNYYVKEDLKDNRIVARFRGTHKDFIKYLQDNKLDKVLEYYNLLIKNARTK